MNLEDKLKTLDYCSFESNLTFYLNIFFPDLMFNINWLNKTLKLNITHKKQDVRYYSDNSVTTFLLEAEDDYWFYFEKDTFNKKLHFRFGLTIGINNIVDTFATVSL